MATPSGLSPQKQFRLTLGLVLGVSLLFGLIVLPRLDPGGSGLEGQQAPDFALPVIHGGDAGARIRLSNLSGQVVVLDFWASWCRACLQQIPILGRVATRNHEGVIVVGVNSNDSPDGARGLLARLNPPYASVEDESGTVSDAYGVSGLPTLVVIDSTGRISAVRTGLVSEDELVELVASARGADDRQRLEQ